MNRYSLPWEKLCGLTTDGAPATTGENNGLVGLLEEKLKNCTNHMLISIHRIIHQEALCAKVCNMEHVMSVVAKSVNFIQSRGLNHRQFQSFLESIEADYGDILYYTEILWLSCGAVLKRYVELHDEIQQSWQVKERLLTNFQVYSGLQIRHSW